MAYVVAEPCVDVLDRSCVDACPVDCIYPGTRMAYIQPDECVDCGACEQVCPVGAIYYEEDVPEEWDGFTRINADVFTEVGAPGGASGLDGGVLPDHEHVVRLPVREAGR
ncbi:ferredoxin [Actinocorallia populi]|uniref:ferredoxin n=1 Tax=Actinocorallia populi TaxID=2079200 RepID=UPI000D0967FF|nr:ferredoxin [Actinocorallia populi]